MGSSDAGLLMELEAHRIEWMCGPKAVGAWYMQSACTTPIETLVLFSSVGSGLAYRGQGNYSASNAWLDAQALSRRAHGKFGCSLQWPVVGGAGMGAAALSVIEEKKITIAGMAKNWAP